MIAEPIKSLSQLWVSDKQRRCSWLSARLGGEPKTLRASMGAAENRPFCRARLAQAFFHFIKPTLPAQKALSTSHYAEFALMFSKKLSNNQYYREYCEKLSLSFPLRSVKLMRTIFREDPLEASSLSAHPSLRAVSKIQVLRPRAARLDFNIDRNLYVLKSVLKPQVPHTPCGTQPELVKKSSRFVFETFESLRTMSGPRRAYTQTARTSQIHQ
jgi:hypothetical protein